MRTGETSLGSTSGDLARLPVELTERGAELGGALSRAAVVGATLEQSIHDGYELRLEVLAPASRSQDLVQLRGKEVAVAFSNEPFVPSVVGAVHRVRALVTDNEGPVRHELFIRPGALALSNTARKRIFYAKPTSEIVDEVFAAHRGASAPSYHGVTPPEPREYTVQYEESDWAFVRRLLADDGIALLAEPQTGRPLRRARRSDDSSQSGGRPPDAIGAPVRVSRAGLQGAAECEHGILPSRSGLRADGRRSAGGHQPAVHCQDDRRDGPFRHRSEHVSDGSIRGRRR